jgi:hypothetical protein
VSLGKGKPGAGNRINGSRFPNHALRRLPKTSHIAGKATSRIKSVAGSGTSCGGGGGGHSGSFDGSQGGGGGPGGTTPPGGMKPGLSKGGMKGGSEFVACGGNTGVGVRDGGVFVGGTPGPLGARPGSRGTGV